ncbi:JAB domain-containing protein [Qipengyuania nanhaisediminis]|uniref:JAB domain-containing protein n=1 Tax=Qipengyuania nanhaisediminis TaxID=604088 RepID=UPI0038B38DEF
MIDQVIDLARTHAPRRARSARHRDAVVDFLRAMVIDGAGLEERMHAIFLDRDHAVLGDAQLGRGSERQLALRLRDLFGKALALDAHGLIVAHNHPSGDCRPSACDITATRRLKAIAQSLDIEVIDHLIVTRHSVYSMRAGGNL